MENSINNILNQLGAAIEAQIGAANDRANTMKAQNEHLIKGLTALIGQPIPHDNESDEEELESIEIATEPTVSKKRSTISNDVFLSALSSEWRTAAQVRKLMAQRDIKVAEGTVYNRMRKLVAAHPEIIEVAANPEQWRLRADSPIKSGSPSKAGKKGTNMVKKQQPAKGMPPKAITQVSALIAAEPMPQQTFEPDLRYGDCFEVMKILPENSVDLILVDPPYAMTDLKIDPLIDLDAMWAEYRRIISPTGTIVAFGSQPFSSRLVCGAHDLFKHDLVWIKNRPTGGLQARQRPMKQNEDILVFSTGAAVQASRSTRRYTYNALGQTSAGIKTVSMGKHSTYLSNVNHNVGREYEGTTNNPRTLLFCRKDGSLHPFQKPVDLLEYLIRTYSNEGDVVLDTFMGSGSTCVGAMKSGRRSIGIEMTEKYFKIAEKRIASTAVETAMAVEQLEAA